MSEHDHDAHGADLKPDTSPPRNELMLVLVLVSVATLFGLKFVFDSYLDHEVHLTHEEHIANSPAADALAGYRAEAESALAGGAMPIDEAARELGTRGRAAFVQIRPAPGDPSRAALEGWASLPVAPAAEPPTATRRPYRLAVDHMPPPDPEADAVEAALEAGALAPPAVLGAPL